MSERIRGALHNALYKHTYTLLYFLSSNQNVTSLKEIQTNDSNQQHGSFFIRH